MLTTIILVVLVMVLLGAIPTWSYSRNWGNGPWSVVVVILIVFVLLMIFGIVPRAWG